MSYLATLKRGPDGGYVDADDVYFETAEIALCDVFGFCGCGAPDLALDFMCKVLDWIDSRSDLAYETWRANEDELFHENPGIKYTILYMLNDKNLTEHGSGVPGWLTDLGHAVLADLRREEPTP
jgi:hypothetical protein